MSKSLTFHFKYPATTGRVKRTNILKLSIRLFNYDNPCKNQCWGQYETPFLKYI